MPISREEVYWLYKALLGRPPESEDAYNLHMRIHNDFEFARQTFMVSKEFQDTIYPPTFYLPRLENGDFLAKPKSLALACIVKNEEERLPLMLTSCVPIVEFVAILDTGSTDNTKNVAGDLLNKLGVPYEISCTTFSNFSQARNEALALVPPAMQWVLMLDGDEHLVREDYTLFAELMTADVDAWALPRYSFTDINKAGPVQSYPDYQRRLIRNRAQNPVRFTGIIHENIIEPFKVRNAPANTERFSGTNGGPHIHHLGGVNVSAEELQKKLDLYLNLLNK